MVRGVTYIVYVLPVVFSIIFGTIVMVDILQEPGRELNMMRFGSGGESSNENIRIIGLEKQYSVNEPVEVQVSIDESYSCGDLYLTIYDSENKAVTQGGYFKQCLDTQNPFLPVKERFTELIDVPGQYEIVAEMLDSNQKNSITTREKFTVR
ncbi:MAG: hypothetical protein R3237_01265 [Nitrosopumilaceae archaeon]|nr:hypothetical protein [Nitrosopumilaceae archaeon]